MRGHQRYEPSTQTASGGPQVGSPQVGDHSFTFSFNALFQEHHTKRTSHLLGNLRGKPSEEAFRGSLPRMQIAFPEGPVLLSAGGLPLPTALGSWPSDIDWLAGLSVVGELPVWAEVPPHIRRFRHTSCGFRGSCGSPIALCGGCAE